MRCPTCQQCLLQETSTACPECGVVLTRLSNIVGMPPTLRGRLNDLGGYLPSRAQQLIEDKLIELQLVFPQCHFNIIVGEPSPKVSLEEYTFWIFNRGGIVPPADQAGRCRNSLVILDPVAKACSFMVGYGLEPFFSEKRLKCLADSCLKELKVSNLEMALLKLIARIHEEFIAVIQNIPRSFGLPINSTLEPQAQDDSFAF